MRIKVVYLYRKYWSWPVSGSFFEETQEHKQYRGYHEILTTFKEII